MAPLAEFEIREPPSGPFRRIIVPDPPPSPPPTQLAGMQAITFAPLSLGDKSGAVAINWADGQKQSMRLTGNVTLTMSAPADQSANYELLVRQSTGGHNITAWPAASRSDPAMRLATAAGAYTVFSIAWIDGLFLVSSYLPSQSPAQTTLV